MTDRQARRALRRQGMTLIEIMIVVVIIAMISAAVGVGVVRVKRDSDLKLARTGLRNLASVAEVYQLTRGSSSECPTLAQLADSKLMRAGSTLDDPWGTPGRPTDPRCHESLDRFGSSRPL
jgi:general secretion pathway protein G